MLLVLLNDAESVNLALLVFFPGLTMDRYGKGGTAVSDENY